ncbi:GH24246 [Drosophila grimshawi]|uniref:GH24246 n=1 Tax=Drosophila grimshawi TaxID=7222 RepID=B4JMX5_DROGR|nr:GH24246 [Drosophila grimshawi]
MPEHDYPEHPEMPMITTVVKVFKLTDMNEILDIIEVVETLCIVDDFKMLESEMNEDVVMHTAEEDNE